MSDTFWFRTISQSYTKLQGQIYLGDRAFVARMQFVLAKDEALQEIPACNVGLSLSR